MRDAMMTRAKIVQLRKAKEPEMKPDEKKLDIVDKLTSATIRRERFLMIIALILGFFAVLALVLYAVRADADDTVRWQHPSSRENGTPLMLSEIASTLIRARSEDGSIESFTIFAPANLTIISRDPFDGKTVCYSGATVDLAGLTSRFSGESCKTNDGHSPPPLPASSPPGSPSAFIVE